MPLRPVVCIFDVVKKAISIFAVLLLVGSYTMGQKGTKHSTRSMLESKTWLMQFATPQNIVCYNQYKDGKVLSVLMYNDKEVKTEGTYYLCDSIPHAFDSTMIGHAFLGKYLVTNSTTHLKEAKVYEIIQLDSQSLVLKYTANNSVSTFKAKEN